jgi:hypothetical protein
MAGAADVPFSHKRHAALKLDCAYCHAAAKTGERAGYPRAAACMVCHQQIAKDKPAIRQLSALPKDTAISPARSVYMLADFVFFSHAKHRSANITCQKCHGNIWAQEVVTQVMPMTMKACITCHKTTHAKVGCSTCHELNE